MAREREANGEGRGEREGHRLGPACGVEGQDCSEAIGMEKERV